jgi:hypothetical protein
LNNLKVVPSGPSATGPSDKRRHRVKHVTTHSDVKNIWESFQRQNTETEIQTDLARLLFPRTTKKLRLEFAKKLVRNFKKIMKH